MSERDRIFRSDPARIESLAQPFVDIDPVVDIESAERERDRYRDALEQIELGLQEGSRVVLPRLWAWNQARTALNGGTE